MHDVRNIYNMRVSEISSYFSLLNELEINESKVLIKDGTVKKINGNLKSTLKATAFLMLYNLIESTIYNSIQAIHDAVNNEAVQYKDLNEKLQILWIEYFGATNTTNNPKMTRKAISFIINKEIVEIDYERYLNIKRLFSGNLDARKIKEVLLKYGCNIKNTRYDKSLLVVKNARNKLAHGETSFSHGGKNYTVSDLNKYRDNVVNFLNAYLNAIEDYISNKKFLVSASN